MDKLFKSPLGQSSASGPSVDLIDVWRRRLDSESKRQRRATLQCLAVGLLLNGLVFGVALLIAEFLARHAIQPRGEAYLKCIGSASVVFGVTFLLAVFTKPEGRAETARAVFDHSINHPADNPERNIAVSFALLISLYGCYCLVEAAKRCWMGLRLMNVDRAQTARILAAICDAPAGLAWQTLLAPGQTLDALRGPVAALILDGWIHTADHGQTLVQRTPAMRKALYRHPLAEVFQTDLA